MMRDVDDIRLAVALAGDDGVPCCGTCSDDEDAPGTATHIGFMDTTLHHDECPSPRMWPMCPDCKRSAKFCYRMRHWPGFAPPSCAMCGGGVTFDRFEKISEVIAQ